LSYDSCIGRVSYIGESGPTFAPLAPDEHFSQALQEARVLSDRALISLKFHEFDSNEMLGLFNFFLIDLISGDANIQATLSTVIRASAAAMGRE
jgi:hypothetical protein